MKKILIIEDQPQMRRNLTTMLELEGFDVACAEDGQLGLAAIKSVKPEMVVCDVVLPGMDGYEILRAVREDKSTATIPFIFLTGKGEKAEQRAGMNLGADDYLVKPVSREDLLAAIKARIQRQVNHQDRLQAEVGRASFNPNFTSYTPLVSLGLTPREAEVLLWVAQGKSNADVAIICDMAIKTVKKHLGSVFVKLGVESRNAASLRALEVLSSPLAQK